jgi:regulator of sirC expression with transglutaminase-like and TPR domain
MCARVLALLSILVPACRREGPPAPALGAIFEVALESGALGSEAARFTRAELQRMAAPAPAALGRGESSAQVLRRVLFEEGRLVREIDSQEPRFMLLPGVLHERRGTCVGLGTLYLVLAERLGVPAHGVLVPGHFFVRIREGGRLRNVELLRQGEEMPDSWYRGKYAVPEAGGGAYMRELTVTEVAAVLRFNLGNELRERGRVEEALARYRRAAADFPSFAEAHASLGLTLQLLGRLEQARGAYEAAQRLFPSLPGLQKNLAALDEELKIAR